MKTESEIESWIDKQIRKTKGLFFKFVSPGNDGVPDRIVILPGGRIIFVELKTDKGRLSPVQKHQISRLLNLGCDCRVIKGQKEAEEFINEIHSARLPEIRDQQNT